MSKTDDLERLKVEAKRLGYVLVRDISCHRCPHSRQMPVTMFCTLPKWHPGGHDGCPIGSYGWDENSPMVWGPNPGTLLKGDP